MEPTTLQDTIINNYIIDMYNKSINETRTVTALIRMILSPSANEIPQLFKIELLKSCVLRVANLNVIRFFEWNDLGDEIRERISRILGVLNKLNEENFEVGVFILFAGMLYSVDDFNKKRLWGGLTVSELVMFFQLPTIKDDRQDMIDLHREGRRLMEPVADFKFSSIPLDLDDRVIVLIEDKMRKVDYFLYLYDKFLTDAMDVDSRIVEFISNCHHGFDKDTKTATFRSIIDAIAKVSQWYEDGYLMDDSIRKLLLRLPMLDPGFLWGMDKDLHENILAIDSVNSINRMNEILQSRPIVDNLIEYGFNSTTHNLVQTCVEIHNLCKFAYTKYNILQGTILIGDCLIQEKVVRFVTVLICRSGSAIPSEYDIYASAEYLLNYPQINDFMPEILNRIPDIRNIYEIVKARALL